MTEYESLSPDWRDQIRALGKENFQIAEMIRLGFLDPAAIPDLATLRSRLDEVSAETASAVAELERIHQLIRTSPTIDDIIREARRERIARVRATREIRREERDRERDEAALERRARRLASPPHLGVGVSDKLDFSGGDDERLTRNGLPIIHDVQELADAIGLEAQAVQWLCFERGAARSDHYSRFLIPKRSGGQRLISSPKPTMRKAQQWIRSTVLAASEPSAQSVAFRPGVSILDNALAHQGATVVVRIDIKDFFPSITFRRVRGWFAQLGYNPGISTVLALLCTDAPRVRVDVGGEVRWVARGPRSLPQGACTSPDLANLMASRMDRRIVSRLAALDEGWRYTRYADDLVLSSPSVDPAVGKAIGIVRNVVRAEGYAVNEKKTAVMRRPNRQSVTGLVLTPDGVSIQRKNLRRVRSFLHACERDGLDAVSERIGKSALHVARGHLAYIHMVMPEHAQALRAKHPWLA